MGSRKIKIDRPTLKALLRLYLIFGAIFLIFIIAFFLQPVRDHIITPFTAFILFCSSSIMNLFGGDSFIIGTNLSTPGYSIDVADGCNGIYATAILISGVLAYPARLKEKLLGILFGIAAIFVINLVRVISLFYLGQYYPDIFEQVHNYVWQALIIFWAIFVWNFWSTRIRAEAKTG